MTKPLRCHRLPHFLAVFAACATTLLTSGCQSLFHRKVEAEPKVAEIVPPLPGEPRATHEFTIAPDDDVVGVTQITKTSAEDTFSDIARRFNLGYEELVRANPGIDPWLPGADREVVLPTQFILPDAPREGLVINLAELRVFYYPKPKQGEPQRVITHPIGIGKVGWSTPEGTTKVTSKRKNPVWTPPDSVRKEHLENGDPLPRQVPPGPDNPLGAYAMTLGWPSYLIHGTNKPYGVGMRSSHGCMRFYPEDIALLFDQIPVGTPVHVVNQPLLMGWHDGALYVQSVPRLEDDQRENLDGASVVLNSAIANVVFEKAQAHGAVVDLETVSAIVQQKRGIAYPVSKRDLNPAQYLALQTRVHNRVPQGATWDGREELYATAEEVEAARSGKPMPKKTAVKAASKSTPAQEAPAKEVPIKEASSGGSKPAGSR